MNTLKTQRQIGTEFFFYQIMKLHGKSISTILIHKFVKTILTNDCLLYKGN
jgi:hypothetical protein